MQKINLTDIIDDIFLNCPGDTTKFLAKTLAKQCALEFGKQLLELAAENVKTGYTGTTMNSSGRLESGKTYIVKQSILDTINQIQ